MRRLAPILLLLFSSVAAAQTFDHKTYLPIVRRDILPLTDVQILPNHSAQVFNFGEDGDRYVVYGEVHNMSARARGLITLRVDFLDAAGATRESVTGSTLLYVFPPGETTCFATGEAAPGWTSYRIQAISAQPYDDELLDLTFSNVTNYYDPASGNYELHGTVRNNSTRPMISGGPLATLYNAAGQVVECAGGPGVVPLPGLQSGNWSMIFSYRDYSDVTAYRLQPAGRYR